MASLTQWTWVWVNSGSWWWTGRPGVLQFIGSQRVGHNWVTDLNWIFLTPTPGYRCDLLFQNFSCKGAITVIWTAHQSPFCAYMSDIFTFRKRQTFASCLKTIFLIQHHLPLLILPWFSRWIDMYCRCVHAYARSAITKYHRVSTVKSPTCQPSTFKLSKMWVCICKCSRLSWFYLRRRHC